MKSFHTLRRFCVILLVAMIFLSLTACKKDKKGTELIFEDGDGYACQYTIVFGENNNAQALAERLARDVVLAKYGISLECISESSCTEGENTILINSTTNAEALAFQSKIEEKYSSQVFYTWGYHLSGKTLIIYFNAEPAADDIIELIASLMNDNGLSLSDGAEYIGHRQVLKDDTYTEAEDSIAELSALDRRAQNAKKINDAFIYPSDDDYLSRFGGKITASLSLMSGITYPTPDIFPQADSHPRININEEGLSGFKFLSENAELDESYTELKHIADKECSTEFSDSDSPEDLLSALNIIEAKAFYYLINGHPAYGYEALAGIKNAILTISSPAEAADRPSGIYSRLITVAAEVYDWCFALTEDKDREQLVAGIEKCCAESRSAMMEFPPTAPVFNPCDSSMTELMCAYLAFSAAIYDEYPDRWSFIAGRFYSEFIEPSVTYFKSGLPTRGSCYSREEGFCHYLDVCRLINTLGGDVPYGDDIKDACEAMLVHLLPNDRRLTGDADESETIYLFKSCMLSGIMFTDPVSMYYAHCVLSKYEISELLCAGSAVHTVLMLADSLGKSADAPDIILLNYDKGSYGMLSTASRKTKDAVLFSVNLGTEGTGGYDDTEIGTFSISYKGLFTGSAEVRDNDSSDFTRYYNKSSISKNGFLIADPDLRESASLNSNGEITNKDGAYYVGSQSSGVGTRAALTGFSCRHSDDLSSLKHTYAAIDYTAAYGPETAELAERRILAVYGEDGETPVTFFIFDRVRSVNEKNTKSFLLQAFDEPKMSTENENSVIINNGECEMVLTSYTDGAQINLIKNADDSVLLNGHAVKPESADVSSYGRIEISTGGSKESVLLNTICVKDAAAPMPEQEMLSAEHMQGIRSGKNIVMFVNDSLQYSSDLELEIQGAGELDYYISGIMNGSWSIFIDGKFHSNICVARDCGLLYFSAPAGRVTLVPQL